MLCVASLSISGLAHAETRLDPFSTEAKLPAKPGLQLGETPCSKLTTDHELGLHDVVNIALCNNPQTRESWSRAQIQAAQLGISQASYLPGLTASVTGNRNSPGTHQRSLGLNLSYLLYDFGARAANLENARQLLAAASATQDSTLQTLFLSSVQMYYQTLATQAAYEAANISERAAQESFAAADARYQAGSATPSDKLAARTAYSQAILNRITAEGAMNIARGNLANLLGLDANQAVMLTAAQSDTLSLTDESRISDVDQNIATLIEQARQRRPDLQAAQAQLLAAEASANAARASGKPSISLNAATSQTNNAGINSHGSTVGLSLNVPLFSGFAPTYRIRAAEAQIETSKAQLERIRLQVALDVWIAWQNLNTSIQNRRMTADLLNSAEQSERMAIGRYKAGAGTMLDVLNAQTALASARQQRIQARYNWNISRATMAQAIGNLDTEQLQSLPNSNNDGRNSK